MKEFTILFKFCYKPMNLGLCSSFIYEELNSYREQMTCPKSRKSKVVPEF